MSNEQILKKAIEKARPNGFFLDEGLWQGEEFYRNYTNSLAYYQIIFTHAFAKAFWGNGGVNLKCLCPEGVLHIPECLKTDEGWQYHLQQMVLEENPIQYLVNFLD